MDNILFKEWFLKHFLCHAGSRRPMLLLMDGHSSHYNLEAVTMAKENGVILFTLVPHTTHEMQPLDTAVYAPLKTNWQDVCHHYLQSHPGKVITKYQFSQLFSEAWLKTMIPANIISGFKSCGIYPFNPKAVLDHDPCVSGSKDCGSRDGDSLSDSTPMVEGDAQQSIENSNSDIKRARDELFTADEEALYRTQYSEGYNLHDPKYISWLKINHPDEDSERFLPLIGHFPDANMPEEIPVLLDTVSTNDTTLLQSDEQLMEPISICERILPGSTPSRKDDSGSKSVSRSLVMETPVTSKGNELTSATTPLTSAVYNSFEWLFSLFIEM